MVSDPKSQRAPPLPGDSLPFTWACQCLNVQVYGRVARHLEAQVDKGSDHVEGETIHEVWVDERGERANFDAYVSYDLTGKPDSVEEEGDDEDSSPAWRQCKICGVKLYRLDSRAGKNEPAGASWVEVDLSNGIIFGPPLRDLPESRLLPFSRLHLELPSRTSQFGKPPQTYLPDLYPRTPTGSTSTHEHSTFVPRVHDPFFLPPPFLPSHPHLRHLCDQAVNFLHESHSRLENEVMDYILRKSNEMQDLEEKVRSEVEMLWTKYTQLPEVELEQRQARDSRSASISRTRSRDPVRHFSPSPTKQEQSNPILNEAVASPPFPAGGSLLAASLSANTYNAPRPAAPRPDLIESSLAEVSKLVDKKSDARAVAMSHVFSVLDDTMQRTGRGAGRSRSTSMTGGTEGVAGLADGDQNDTHGKDSWIDAERSLVERDKAGDQTIFRQAVDPEDSDPGTPKAKEQVNSASKETPIGRDKGKTVSFQEPGRSRVQAITDVEEAILTGTEGTSSADPKDDDDDYVFDFELEEAPGPSRTNGSGTSPPSQTLLASKPDILEASLSKTFAADFPSHRAAWREHSRHGPMLSVLRKQSTGDEEDDEEGEVDETQISKLAISMPVGISLPKNRRPATKNGIVELERKTSLSERKGILVPPLIAAMRQRGIPQPNNSLGLGFASGSSVGDASGGDEGRLGRRSSGVGGSSRGGRSASVSRERNQAMAQSFIADPGAAFESLADGQGDEDGSDEGDEGDVGDEGGGTLRDSRNFIPPHVLAGKKSGDRGTLEAGWRSLVTE